MADPARGGARHLLIPRLIVACCAVLGGSLSGCTPGDRAPTTGGTTLRLYYSGNETVFSPSDWVPFRKLVFATLLRRGPEGPEGWLVDDWSASDDGHTWTYRLRDNARWHDGVPITTEDVAYSLELLYNPPVRAPREPRFELEVLDERTFRIRYEDVRIKRSLEYDVFCFPRHRLQVLDREGFWNWEFWVEPIGNGPFRYVRHVPDVMTQLAADPGYFLPGPGVDSVMIRYGGIVRLELLAENVDVHVWASADDIPTFMQNPDLDYALYGGSVSILYWNHRRPFFRDARARRAVTLAIDRESLLLSRDIGVELPVLDAPIAFLEREAPSDPIPFDRDEAARTLRDLGWEDADGDGVLERDGEDFRVEILVASGDQADEAVYVQDQLRRVGIAVEIRTTTRTEVEDRVRTGDFDAAFHLGRDWPWLTMGEGLELLDPSRPSLIGYDYADLYEAMVARRTDFADDADARLDRRLWEIFQRDVPVTVLGPSATAVVFNRRVRGLTPWLGFEFMDRARIDSGRTVSATAPPFALAGLGGIRLQGRPIRGPPRPAARQSAVDAEIVFVSDRDGIEDIYTIRADGSGARRVTVTEPVEGETRGSWVPAWSPDRTRIVFASNRDDGGSANLYVVDADGADLRRLTDHDDFDYTPDWSHDGTTIAFVSNRDGFDELYAMDADGSNVRRLTHLEVEERRLCCPDWSPDGRRIAFTTRTPRAEIQVLDVASGQVGRLGPGALPRWSPDGEWIAYWGPGQQVHLMRADGSDPRQITSMQGMANYAAWSPDGEWIVFTHLPEIGEFDRVELYVVGFDGSGLQQITNNDAMDAHANWW